MNKIHIAYSCDDNYVLPLCCSLKSLIMNAKNDDEYIIHVLHNSEKLSEKSKELILLLGSDNCKIDFIPIEKELFNQFTLSGACPHTTIETYYRFILGTVLCDTDKVLYLDCDTNILADLSYLYNLNINDKYIVACDDFSSSAYKKRLNTNQYFNAGVILFNLKKIREDNIEQKLFEYALTHKNSIPMQDQDVMNVIFQHGVLMVDRVWNTQVAYYSPCSENIVDNIFFNSKIIHYICEIKPWQYEYKALFRNIFFRYFFELPQEIQLLLLNYGAKQI